MTEIRTQVVIVGGGPAGMAAARVLHEHDIECVIVDEGQRPGGQIFRQRPATFRGGTEPRFEPPSHAAGHELIHDVDGIRFLAGATVWDIEPDRVHVECAGEALTLIGDKLLLATGAMDRMLPFPGWTLPGVITAGAAQVMVRGQALRPGQRAVVAGTGPLLLPTVTALQSAGVQVVGLFEANPFSGLLRAVPAVIANGHRRTEAWHYAWRLHVGRLAMKYGRAVIGAHGDGSVERVALAKLDGEGRPRAGTEFELEADVLCVGYGLTPSIELAVRLGCSMHHREVRGGWLPEHDENMQTSVPGVYVAGEIAGIGGGDVAMAEGKLAGYAIATTFQDRGYDFRSLHFHRDDQRRSADAMLAAFPILPGLYDIPQRDTIVCRCEDVTMAQVEQASRTCGADIRSVKLATRAGMGPCQARICHRLIGGILRQRFGGSEFPTPCPVVQVPIKPVSTRTMTRAVRDDRSSPNRQPRP